LNGTLIHNPIATPDGKYVGAGSPEGKSVTIIDTTTDQPVWDVKFDGGVMPFAFSANPDGSTKYLVANLSGMAGFVVVDFQTHKQIRRVEIPFNAGGIVGMSNPRDLTGALHQIPSHGVGVAPDNTSVWVNTRTDQCVYAYSLPDFKLLGYVPYEDDAMWMTFTPDSKKLYVANNGSGTVSVIDVKARKLIGLIPVGEGPKRNSTAMLP
jgi:YVTN family beta-propeller protein